MIDFIKTRYDSLDGIAEYDEKKREDAQKKNEIVNALSGVSSLDTHVIAQALGEAGKLNNFAWQELYNLMNAFKMANALPIFEKNYAKFKELGRSNPWGDTYMSTFSYDIPFSEDQKRIRKITQEMAPSGKPEPSKAKTEVLLVEGQSPVYAAILNYSAFTGNKDSFVFVRLKRECGDPCKLEELKERKFQFDSNFNPGWEDEGKSHGIIAYLKLKELEMKPCLEPYGIDRIINYFEEE